MRGPRKSPTRLELLKLCARKWAIKELVGIDTASYSSDFGTALHAEMEYLHGSGERPHHPRHLGPEAIRTRAKQIYDWQCQHGLIGGECELNLDAAGLPYTGRADYVWRGDGRVVLCDYKTTTGALKYTPHLTRNIQTLLYARLLMELYGVDTVECIWLYVPQNVMDPWVLPVYAVVRRPDTEECHAAALAGCAEMDRLFAAGSVPAAPTDTECCKAYGGCAYKRQCKTMPAGELSVEAARAEFGGITLITQPDRHDHRRQVESPFACGPRSKPIGG